MNKNKRGKNYLTPKIVLPRNYLNKGIGAIEFQGREPYKAVNPDFSGVQPKTAQPIQTDDYLKRQILPQNRKDRR